MANEFKVKKGLIVDGTGTVLDVQGTQGQLFSVTDDLSGSIFAVSDISGVPIFDVNSSGVSYFDGSVGIGTATPSSPLHIGGTEPSNGVSLAITTGTDDIGLRASPTRLDIVSSTATVWRQLQAGSFVGNVNEISSFAGNVGIGTTSPNTKLQVSALNSNYVNLTGGFSVVKAEEGYGMYMGVASSGSSWIQSATYNNSATYPLILNSAGGNVGIGTTTPFGTAANRTVLSVNGTTDVSLNVGTGGSQRAYLYGSSTYADLGTIGSLPLVFSPNNTERMRITSGGNVFFNATSAASYETFGVAHQWSRFYTTSATDYALVDVGNATTRVRIGVDSSTGGSLATGTSAYASYVGSSGAYPLQLGSYGGVGITINSSNNVGIGTTEPGTKLEVSYPTGAGTNNGVRFSYGADANYRLDINQVVSSGLVKHSFDVTNAGTLYASNLVLDRGNVGIGTTAPLADGLTIRREGGDRKVLLRLDRPNTAGLQTALQFTVSDIMVGQIQHEYAASNFNHMSFTLRSAFGDDIIPLWLENSGNVGIGTTAPLNLLHVSQASANTIFRLGNNASYDQFIYFNGGNDWSLGMDYSNSNAFVLSNASSIGTNDRIVVTTGGNVGIGTTGPNFKVEMQGGSFSFGGVNTKGGAYVYGGALGEENEINNHRAIAIGASNIVSGDGAIAIGKGITVSGAQSIGIGLYAAATKNQATVSTANVMSIMGGNVGIGTTGPAYALDVSGTIRATGDVIAYSDARVKENVETIPNAIDKVKAMRGVGYNKIGEQRRSTGVIAQEILEVLPEVVHQDENGMYSVAYGNIVGVLIEAIKEQQNQIDELKSRLNNL